jgi:5'-3' exonuclease
MTKNIILIDGSYFVFYRYYAIMAWWKIAKKDTPLCEHPIENEEFVSSFKRTFIKKIKEIPKKLKIKNAEMSVAKDCTRSDIWRNEFIDDYKGNRDYSNFHGQPFFKMAYDELFAEAGIQHVLYHPRLEADDCIAIATKHLINTVPDVKVTIITADHDYLQLINDQTDIFTLKLKPLRTEKNSSGNAECDLFCKIVLGDKSDNIPRVFNKCGKKTALKLWNDKNSLRDKLEKENAEEKFNRNKKLIDFREIPEELSNDFLFLLHL